MSLPTLSFRLSSAPLYRRRRSLPVILCWPLLALSFSGCGEAEVEFTGKPLTLSQDTSTNFEPMEDFEITEENEGTCRLAQLPREQPGREAPAADTQNKTEDTQPSAPTKEPHPHPAAPVAKPRVQPVPGSSLSNSILTAPQRN